MTLRTMLFCNSSGFCQDSRSLRSSGQILSRALLVAVGLALTVGCGTIRKTTTTRTPTEMLLCSNAAERSVNQIDTSKLKGWKVYVDDSFLVCYDKGYVVSSVFEHLSRSGALVTRDKADSQITLELRSGGVGTYFKTYTIGVPDALGGGVNIERQAQSGDGVPMLFTFGYELQEGWAHIQAFAYITRTGAYLSGSTESWGRAHRGFFNDVDEPVGVVDGVVADAK